MLRQRRFLVESLTAVGLIAVPFVLPYLDFAPNTVNRILVWGLFGIGFDILFGYTGLLSFGQSALYGTGGMVTAYLLTTAGFPHIVLALIIGMIVAALVGYLVGLIALRRTGIYFAMITVAIAEIFYFVEFNPLAHWTGGENGLPGVPSPVINLGFTTLHFTTGWSFYPFVAFFYFIGVTRRSPGRCWRTLLLRFLKSDGSRFSPPTAARRFSTRWSLSRFSRKRQRKRESRMSVR